MRAHNPWIPVRSQRRQIVQVSQAVPELPAQKKTTKRQRFINFFSLVVISNKAHIHWEKQPTAHSFKIYFREFQLEYSNNWFKHLYYVYCPQLFSLMSMRTSRRRIWTVRAKWSIFHRGKSIATLAPMSMSMRMATVMSPRRTRRCCIAPRAPRLL